jgi:anti-anti-sigma regulatory factor
MPRPYRKIVVECTGDVYYARLENHELQEPEVHEMAEDLLSLVLDEGCRKLVLSLGPQAPRLIYSVFVGKLLMVRRRLQDAGGALKLCEVPETVREVFDALQLTQYFEFYPDRESAEAAFAEPSPKE